MAIEAGSTFRFVAQVAYSSRAGALIDLFDQNLTAHTSRSYTESFASA